MDYGNTETQSQVSIQTWNYPMLSKHLVHFCALACINICVCTCKRFCSPCQSLMDYGNTETQSQVSIQTWNYPMLSKHLVHFCAFACINICAHIKDPVVYVRVPWIMETLKHRACTVGWVARICRSWLSLGKGTRISYGRIPIGTTHL